MEGTRSFVQHVDTARQFQADSVVRVEAETEPQVNIGLAMAKRASHPEERPPEAQRPVAVAQPAKAVVYNFS